MSVYGYVWWQLNQQTNNSRNTHISGKKEACLQLNDLFNDELSTKYGKKKQSISTDRGTWYPQACKFLKLEHHLHSTLEKGIIEKTVQYVKDRT